MTTAERLKQISGLAGGLTAAAMLLAAAAGGATAGELLVSRSGLDTGTAAAHLLADGVDHEIPSQVVHQSSGGDDRLKANYDLTRRILQDDQDVIEIINMWMVTNGFSTILPAKRTGPSSD